MIYLASPYTHPVHTVMEQRFDAACRAAGKLMREGHVVFSPIANMHPIAVRCELPRDWKFWQAFDVEFIKAAEKMLVVKLLGWEASKGVAAEIQIASDLGIPVEYIEESEAF